MSLIATAKARLYNSLIGFEALRIWSYIRPGQALNDIDQRLREFLPFENGVYLEVGANNGISQSNTILLERRFNWSGLLIEPVPRLFRQCRRARKGSTVVNFAITPPEWDGKDVEIYDLGLMSLVNSFDWHDRNKKSRLKNGTRFFGKEPSKETVTGHTLSSLIDKYETREIDLLSLDIEGYEVEALRGLDMTRHKPKLILIETVEIVLVAEILDEHYVCIGNLTHHDYLFQRK
jgi:FkbM family methyltransferase